MTSPTPATGTSSQSGLDRILESAVVLSWSELMQASRSGLIHVEYRTGSDRAIEYLKVWSATTKKGRWSLVCEYWGRALWSHAVGIRFEGACHSADFAAMLEFVMLHQHGFSSPSERQDGLVQVSPPTEDERLVAKNCMSEAVNRLGSSPAEQLVAQWSQRRTRWSAPAQPVLAH
jgi:hypothetical protein